MNKYDVKLEIWELKKKNEKHISTRHCDDNCICYKNMKGNVIEESSKINADFKHIVGKVRIYSMLLVRVDWKFTPYNV